MKNNELINEAVLVINQIKIKNTQIGTVGCALLTDNNSIYKGVCIDTSSGMGFCAEHTAISQMVTNKEYKIKKIVAVWKDEEGSVFVIPPCGRCREFMRQINEENLENTEVVLDKDKTVILKELLPYYDWWQKQ
jgi:cytidine deaminase